MRQYATLLLACWLFLPNFCIGQQVEPPSFAHISIPDAIKEPALLALEHYPELRGERIEFRIKSAQLPYAARPRIWTLFLPFVQKRYVITISNRATSLREPSLIQNLSAQAQVGALGHELAHIAWYQKRSKIRILSTGVRYACSDTFKGHLEKETDRIAIAHGLGAYILKWNEEVYPIKMKDGKRGSRYYTPDEIRALVKNQK